MKNCYTVDESVLKLADILQLRRSINDKRYNQFQKW